MTHVLLAGSANGVDELAGALEGESVSVTRVEDAVDALEALSTADFDAVATTVDPGPVAARGFVRRLRRSGYGGPVVLALGEADDLTRALAGDADAVVPLGDPRSAATAIEDRLADERLDAGRSTRRLARSAVEAAVAALEDVGGAEEAGRTLCTELAPAYRSVWFGRHDREADAVRPVAATGVGLDHLAAIPLDAESPTARAVESGEVERDRSGVVVPVAGGKRTYGVLYVHAERAIADAECALLGDLGRRAGRAFVRAEAGPEEPADRFAVLGDTLAHELANLVNVATMHLELAREREDDDSHFEYVESSLARMAALADDARALARDELELGVVSLEEVVAEAWRAEGTDGATLEVESVAVEADRDQLRLVLENLLRNAVEHGGDDVTVGVGALADGFYVEDDGPGIPPEKRERVLEWGVSESGGTGVGLGIVSLAARRHGWTVEVEESEAGGARFEFR